MDIIEILVLVAFIILPLFQAVLEKIRGAGRRETPPDLDPGMRSERSEAEWQPPVTTREKPASVHHPVEEAATEDGWSAGWGRWPSEAETLEDLSAEPVVSEAEAEEIIQRQDRLEDSKAVSEAAMVTAPVVSMEPLHVDHSRREPRRATKRPTLPPPPSGARRHANPVRLRLKTRSELRRAIILAEVLGPPRALQSTEPHPDR